MKTVWVAIAQYAEGDGSDPIIVAATSELAANQALEAAIRAHITDEGMTESDVQELMEMWITEHPVELPIQVAIVNFSVTEENIEVVHTYLEGAFEVEQDDNANGVRAQALAKALNDSTEQLALPHTISIPDWLSEELDKAIDEDADFSGE